MKEVLSVAGNDQAALLKENADLREALKKRKLEKKEVFEMNIFERLHAVTTEVESISKKGQVAFGATKYKYAKESDFVEAVKPLLVKYRIHTAVQMEPLPIIEGRSDISQVRLVYVFTNIDAPKESVVMSAVGQGQDKGDKGIYKAITGAKKYLLANTFVIPTHDDPEGTDEDGKSTNAGNKGAQSATSFRKPKPAAAANTAVADDNDF